MQPESPSITRYLPPPVLSSRKRTVVLVLVIGLLLQGFHMVEHIVQLFQWHLLGRSPFHSHGLLGAFNIEWVHFSWNWIVVALILYLIRGGMRNRWSWLLLLWVTAHSLEHTYLTIRYLLVEQALARLALPSFAAANGLPGILGRNGWLAESFHLRIPFLTMATRIDIHFVWNAGAYLLMLLAAYRFLRDRPGQRSEK